MRTVEKRDQLDASNGVMPLDVSRSALTVGFDRLCSGAPVLRLDGEVDLATIDLFGDVVNALVETGRLASVSVVVVDLDRVTSMIAAGAGILGRAGRQGPGKVVM